MLHDAWRIEMFGGLRVISNGRTISRFRTQKAGSLLAYLASHLGGSLPREELIELLWPGADPDKGRMSLRTALASLRRQLEPPGTPSGGILAADAVFVRLNSSVVSTDVCEYENELGIAATSSDDSTKAAHLAKSVGLYTGPLLSGYYDDWILPKRDRLHVSYLEFLRRLTRLHVAEQNIPLALEFAQKAAIADPLSEELHRDVIRLYLALGHIDSAARQFDRLQVILRDELGTQPSESTLQLASELRRRMGSASLPIPTRTKRSRRQPAQTTPEPVHPALMPQTQRLPPRFTRFFGRTEELERLVKDLRPIGTANELPHSPRLITLAGPGGTGKTRLALETAERMAPAYRNRVWFIPLEDIRDAQLIPGAIADVLGLRRSPSIPPMEQVVAHLSERSSLLVLDNFEQLADSGASIVLSLLSRIESLRCVVTSRRRLALPAERVLPLPPLPTPVGEPTPERLMDVSSVQLFVDRAQAVMPDFQLTPGNARAVAGLCERLEGLPLALELAAARAQMLTPGQMLEKLSERFELLATRRADKASRHRSLWAAIDWSFHLLSPELQRFFVELSVFSGGWSTHAASEICRQTQALDYLTQLRVHSLIQTEASSTEMRFRLLDSIREYAETQLSPDARVGLEARHRDYYAGLAETARKQYSGGEQVQVLDRLELEHENLRAALRGGLEKQPRQAMQIAADLWRFWQSHGHYQSGRLFLEKVLDHPANQLPLDNELANARAFALNGAGSLAWSQGDLETARHYQEQCLEAYRAIGDEKALAYALIWFGNVVYHSEDFVSARQHYEESLPMFRDVGDSEGEYYALIWLGNVASRTGDYVRAIGLYDETLRLAGETGNTQVKAFALNGLGYVAFKQGRYSDAELLHRECIDLRRQLGDRLGIAGSLEHFAFLSHAQSQHQRAVEFASAAEKLREELGAPLPPMVRREYDEMLSTSKAKLGPSRFRKHRNAGRALEVDETIEMALHQVHRSL